MSIRDHFVLSYAEHLHSDPTLFEIELEYMGRCGTIGRERISAVISHIPVIPPPVSFSVCFLQLPIRTVDWHFRIRRILRLQKKLCPDSSL
jgi:hypothetical protein